MAPSGFSPGSSGQRVMRTTTASPSLPLLPSEPLTSMARGRTMGPRTRLSSGSSQALLPLRLSVPATRFMPRSTTDTTSPSAPRAVRERTRTRTRSPCIAPPMDSGGMNTSSPAASRLATKPKPRGCTVSSPSRSAPRDAAVFWDRWNFWPGRDESTPSKLRSSSRRWRPR